MPPQDAVDGLPARDFRVTAGDYNGDRITDLILSNDDDGTRLYLGEEVPPNPRP